jgi:O-antigen/teichoic acid export membrane protein
MLSVSIWLLAEEIAIVAFDSQNMAKYIRPFTLAIPLLTATDLIAGVFRGVTNARARVFLQDVVGPLTRLGATVVVVGAGLPLVWIANGWVIAFAITALVGFVTILLWTPILDYNSSPIARLEFVSFATPLMVSAAMGVLLGNADTLLLGYFTTPSIVGIYDSAFAVSTLIIGIYTAFGFLFLPVFSRLHADEDQQGMQETYSVITKWMTTILAPVYLTLVFFSSTLLSVTFGEPFAIADSALIILLTGMYLRTVTGLGGQALTAIGEPRAVMIGNVVGVASNIGLNIVLIPRYGLVGAAIATALVSAGLDGLYLLYLYRQTGVAPSIQRLVYPLLGGSVVVLSLFYFLDYLQLPGIIAAICGGVLSTGVFSLTYLLWGVDEADIHTAEIISDKTGLDLVRPIQILSRNVE